MTVVQEVFGKTQSGAPVELYTLANSSGMKAKIMTFGATLVSVETPDRQGNFDNVTVHLDSFAEYEAGHPCLGSVCGRYANRIAKGKFQLDGVSYALATNNGVNHLHGGPTGFDKRIWDAKPVEGKGFSGVLLTYTSADGEEGYPGKLVATVQYSVTDDNRLTIDYTAKTDRPTVVNLTNHTYWNLAAAGPALWHELTLNADRYLPIDETQIPLGELRPVKGTPMDFTTPHTVGSRIAQVEGGYDHCYVLCQKLGEDLSMAARVFDPKSGRVMEVFTTEPGVQLYTANGLHRKKASGVVYDKHAALCLETQHFPDSPNQPHFPTTVLRPGQTYHHLTVHKFSVAK
jgi:aldose 1-epimerase